MISGKKLQILSKKSPGNPNLGHGSAYLFLQKTLRTVEAAGNFMLSEKGGPQLTAFGENWKYL